MPKGRPNRLPLVTPELPPGAEHLDILGCRKKPYASKEDALANARGSDVAAYKCPACPGAVWHWSRQEQSRDRRRGKGKMSSKRRANKRP